MSHPFDDIPELAGVATWDSAARVGYSVHENVRRLLRYQWVERRAMATLVAHLPSVPVWEVKCAMALHQWQSAEHVETIRTRIGEMRSPVPKMDSVPEGDPSAGLLDDFLTQVWRSRDVLELVVAVYGVLYPALADSYREHVGETNPLVDHPTRRILRMALAETEDAVAWGAAALEPLLAADPSARPRAAEWQRRLEVYLARAGGISGDASSPAALDRVDPVAESDPDFYPRRDERFHGRYNFEFPPHVVYNMPDVPADERNLALLCKRALEMDVPEMMASFITERTGQPWEFYRDYSRQLWDEARHAMMGTVALESRGVDWKRGIPLNVGFALRLNLHATPRERQAMLFAIEQSLMPADTGKRFEYETARAAGDELSAHFHDYDWADEVLHAQIGRRALRRDGMTPHDAAELGKQVHEKTWAALDQYRHLDAQENWWPAFVRKVLGRESAVAGRDELGPVRVLSE
jgi:hypothetical protein